MYPILVEYHLNLGKLNAKRSLHSMAKLASNQAWRMPGNGHLSPSPYKWKICQYTSKRSFPRCTNQAFHLLPMFYGRCGKLALPPSLIHSYLRALESIPKHSTSGRGFSSTIARRVALERDGSVLCQDPHSWHSQGSSPGAPTCMACSTIASIFPWY